MGNWVSDIERARREAEKEAEKEAIRQAKAKRIQEIKDSTDPSMDEMGTMTCGILELISEDLILIA